MPENRRAGLTARVTGAGPGLGKDIAMALGQEGAHGSVRALHANDGACETVDAVLHKRVQAMAI